MRNLHNETWALMNRLCDQDDFPWIMSGDFNEITDGSEKSGSVDRNETEMRKFREAIDRCGLLDPGFIGPRFTWCNNHVGQA